MQIYIARAGNQQGPYSLEELNTFAQSEPITGDDLCWYKGCAEWIPLSQLPGFIPAPPPSPTAVPQSENDTLYYLLQNNEQAGPYTVGQLRTMWQNGKVNAQTQYCAAGGTSWQPLITLRTVVETAPVQSTPVFKPQSLGVTSIQAPQPIPQSSQLSSASAAVASFRSDAIGYIMLIIPAVAALLIWQSINFGLPPIALSIVAVIATAILGGIEAKQLGMGSDSDKTPDGKKNSGPGWWAALILLMWCIWFPAYLYTRKCYGARNLLWPAVIVSLAFGIAFFVAAPELPSVDAPEIVHLAERAIRESPAIKVSAGIIGPVSISNPGEISYDKTQQRRVARAELKTSLGSEVIYYTVEWQNRSKGIIWVQIQAHP